MWGVCGMDEGLGQAVGVGTATLSIHDEDTLHHTMPAPNILSDPPARPTHPTPPPPSPTPTHPPQVIYIAPLKALVRERIKDWGKGLCPALGKRMVELTGDYTPDMVCVPTCLPACLLVGVCFGR